MTRSTRYPLIGKKTSPDNQSRITDNCVMPSHPDNQERITDNSDPSDRFYALRDISFEVKQGEILGIIGKNGAGKSTLLKILSKVTTPTRGQIKIKGRVASLLEVGTGFHPELTGRENVFLNGAILGMSKADLRKKFDEIVAFAEVEKIYRHTSQAILLRHACAASVCCSWYWKRNKQA